MNYNNKIFKIKSEKEFEYYAIRIFRMQYKLNPVYQSYCNLIGTNGKTNNPPPKCAIIV